MCWYFHRLWGYRVEYSVTPDFKFASAAWRSPKDLFCVIKGEGSRGRRLWVPEERQALSRVRNNGLSMSIQTSNSQQPEPQSQKKAREDKP